MRGDTFNIYDPFARQRKKRTGSASDFGILYEQGIDKPAIAKLVEATRRTERRRGERDEAVIEERAERIDAQARTDAANATYGDAPFAPRDFAAKQGIDLRLLGSTEFNSPTFLRAPPGTEERKFQDANAAFGLPEFQAVMSIPERRKTPRPANSGGGFGQFQGSGGNDQLRGGIGNDFLSVDAGNSPLLPTRPKPPGTGTAEEGGEKGMGALDQARKFMPAASEIPRDYRGEQGARNLPPYFNLNGINVNQVPIKPPKDFRGVAWNNDLPFFTDGVKRLLSSRFGWRYLKDKPKDFHSG